ncbi:MAG: methyltransferase domain-containing protein [Ruegeria sp.]|uniref:methyltransferase domain-containing protein n=1 Tax=Ruegeria sp. TaxID=1879320 RepID=UPI00349EAE54
MNVLTAERVQRSFTRSFQSYHDGATQQARVAQLLARRLAHLGAPVRFAEAFEFGCGTGHLTHALSDRFRIASLILNDLVPSAAQLANTVNAEFLPGDARVIDWPEAPDLIASASTLQWMEAPEDLLARAARALAPGGWLVVSSYGPAQYRELAALGSAAQAPGLRGADLLADAIATTDAGRFDVLEARERTHRLWFDTPRDVLRHLRHTGVNAKASKTWTRADLSQFDTDYRAAFGRADQVPLTYHPVWIIARKRP